MTTDANDAARTTGGPARIKRGIGLILVAVLGWALLAAFYAATRDTEFGLTMAAALLKLAASFAVVGCLAVGVVLLLWGLFRD